MALNPQVLLAARLEVAEWMDGWMDGLEPLILCESCAEEEKSFARTTHGQQRAVRAQYIFILVKGNKFFIEHPTQSKRSCR
jgi:hypothetical protein